VLGFWEPNAPDFHERFMALRHAYNKGFATSVSCEPMLDNNVHLVIDYVEPLVTDSIWLGKANQLIRRLKANGHTDETTISIARMVC
jgi:DNA repair photolyase